MQNVRVAFSGSGFLAPIHAGAVCGMLDSEKSILEVAGTSGGSIAAALVLRDMPAEKTEVSPNVQPQQESQP